MPSSLTIDQVKQRIQAVDNSQYELEGSYLGANKPIQVRHKACGKITSVLAKNFFQENAGRCRNCVPIVSKRGPIMTEEVFCHRVNEQLDEKYIVGKFNGYKFPIDVKHIECGTMWTTTPHMLIGTKKRRCPNCANTKRGSHLRSLTYLNDILQSKTWGNEYRWLEDHNGDNKEKLRILHLNCNLEYSVRPNDFQQGYRCPHCQAASIDSYGVRTIIEVLEEFGINYEREVKFPGLKFIKPLKFDFHIELNDRCHLVIEYDGEQHFQTSGYVTLENLRKTKIRDAIKDEFCKSNPKFYLHRINFRHDVRKELLRILDLYFDLVTSIE